MTDIVTGGGGGGGAGGVGSTRSLTKNGYVFIGDQLTNLKTLTTYMSSAVNNWSSFYDDTGTAYTPSGSNIYNIKSFEINVGNTWGGTMNLDLSYADTSPGLNSGSAPSTIQYYGHGSAGILRSTGVNAGDEAVLKVNWTLPNGKYLIASDNIATNAALFAYGYESSS